MRNFEKRLLPDRWQEGSRRRTFWNITRFLGLVVVVTLFYFLLPYVLSAVPVLEPFDSPADRLTATSIFATLLLTFALISVYRDIGMIQQDQVDEMQRQRGLQEDVVGVQERQSEIMERQEELMEIDHRPHVTIETWRVQMNKLGFSLRNVGNGPATDLTAILRIYDGYSSETLLFEGVVRLSPKSSKTGEVRSGESSFGEIRSGIIEPDGKVQTFEGSPVFIGGPEFMIVLEGGFSTIVHHMIESGVETIGFEVYLAYDMINEEKNETKIFHAASELHEDMDLEDLIEESHRHNLEFDYVLPENLKVN